MATEKRLDLIDRKGLIKAVEKKQFAIAYNTHPYEAIRIQGKYFREVVDNAPTVDAVEVVHGRWIMKETMIRSPFAKNAYCSVCLEETSDAHNYCPNCGARMDGDGDA